MCIIDYIEGNTPKQCIGTWIEVLKLLLLFISLLIGSFQGPVKLGVMLL
jgi:hypothetical protein